MARSSATGCLGILIFVCSSLVVPANFGKSISLYFGCNIHITMQIPFNLLECKHIKFQVYFKTRLTYRFRPLFDGQARIWMQLAIRRLTILKTLFYPLKPPTRPLASSECPKEDLLILSFVSGNLFAEAVSMKYVVTSHTSYF